MDIENINKQIQAENDSYNRNLNGLQQKILDLKRRHQRRISDLQNQKQQATSQNKHERLDNQYKLSENIFKSVNQALNKFIYN